MTFAYVIHISVCKSTHILTKGKHYAQENNKRTIRGV